MVFIAIVQALPGLANIEGSVGAKELKTVPHSGVYSLWVWLRGVPIHSGQ